MLQYSLTTAYVFFTFPVKSLIEATKFLLSNGVEYVRTIVFCQDPLEEHFGRHRALGRRSDNPTLWGFGYVNLIL